MKAPKSFLFSSLFFLVLFLQANASLDRRQSSAPPASATTTTGETTTSTTNTIDTTTTAATTLSTATTTTTPPPASDTTTTTTSSTPPPTSTPNTATNTQAPTTTAPPTTTTAQVSIVDGDPTTEVVSITGSSSSTSSAPATSSSASSDSDSDGSSGLGTGSIVGLSVAGGVALIGIVGFFIWKFTRKRFSDFDDNEAIKWPDLNTHGAGASDSHPLPVNNTGRSGFDTGSEGSLSRVPSTNYSTPDFASSAADPYAVPPLPHLNPNQPYRDDPGAVAGYYDPYRGPIPGTIEHGAPGGQPWGGEAIPMTQLSAGGRMSPGPHAAYGGEPPYEYDVGNGRQSPGAQAAYGGRTSPGPQAAYGGRASPGPQAAYGAGGRMSPGPHAAYAGAVSPQPGPGAGGDYHDGYTGR